MDREKVIKGMRMCISQVECSPDDCPYYIRPNNASGLCWDRLMTDALALIKEHGWTLIMEDADGYLHGLPGDDGQYLMTDGKDIWIDDYVDGVDDGVWLDSGRDIREIRAWMYMPKLPILN